MISVASILRKAGAPAFLSTDPSTVRYCTGVSLSEGVLLITHAGISLYTDSRYIEEACCRVQQAGVSVHSIEDLRRRMQRIHMCAMQADRVFVQDHARWMRTYKNTKFIQTNGLIEGLRRKKSTDELREVRGAQRCTLHVLRQAERALKPGVSERAIAGLLHAWAQERGAEGLAFDPIVAFGSHTSRPHHHPTQRKLRARDIVQIDVGVRWHGYCADKSRVYFIGEPTERQRHIYAAVHLAKRTATTAVRPGVTNHELDRIARVVLHRYGLEQYFTHSLGHGIGLDVHEGISLSQRAPEQQLLRGEVVTIEPGVYLPGRFGIRLEDEVVVGTAV
ncbi:M24 family metallopeptidase [Candidatus Peribacteria bacterium]|nr:M24 family metallopeptidase [Candidatus Peribacteria bacterium]